MDLPSIPETTALGAAFAAGLAVGTWPNIKAVQDTWKRRLQYLPAMEASTREKLVKFLYLCTHSQQLIPYSQLKGWEKAIARSMDWEDNHYNGSLAGSSRKPIASGASPKKQFSTFSRVSCIGPIYNAVPAVFKCMTGRRLESFSKAVRSHSSTTISQKNRVSKACARAPSVEWSYQNSVARFINAALKRALK